MTDLQNTVQRLMESFDDEINTIESLVQKQRELAEKQEEKVRETAFALLPLMEKIKDEQHYFIGNETDYRSTRGPILKHDKNENMLYIFSVQKQQPISLNLYDQEEKPLSYRKLLEAVEFPLIMKGLLITLTHLENLKKRYQENNEELDAELERFKNYY
ncbi:hypothetical protein [Peribacillus frigoritolerans]|uniref:hypothetical protein n=1 Tax=Peribacillus frigoritolerans TaxID=450367 RepID=UPI0036323068